MSDTNATVTRDLATKAQGRAKNQYRVRVMEVRRLIASHRWDMATRDELQAEWGATEDQMQAYHMAACAVIDALLDRDAAFRRVGERADAWIDEDGPDRVQSARLLLDSVGGVEHRVAVQVQEMDLDKVVKRLVRIPQAREAMIAALEAWHKEQERYK